MRSLFTKQSEKRLGLMKVLVTFGGAFAASAGNYEFINSVTLRRWNVNVDTGAMQDNRWLGFADEKIEKS